jgi:hypothetical protein
MAARCWRRVRWAPEQAELSPSTTGQSVAQWMQTDAENRAGREFVDSDSVSRNLGGAAQLH